MKMELTFPHPVDPTQNHKLSALIAKHKATGYGVYWRIIELMLQNEGKLPLKGYMITAIAGLFACSEEFIHLVITDCIGLFDLFQTDESHFWASDLAEVGKKKKTNRVETYRPNKEILKKWEQAISAMSQDIAERYLSTKAFIDNEKPDFVEPYATVWNLFAHKYKLAQIEAITETRKNKFASRIKDPNFRWFDVLDGIKKSEFYRGITNSGNWKVDWDYIFENDTNYLKIIERK